MKKLIILLLLFVFIIPSYAQVRTVQVPQAGKLKSLIKRKEYNNITQLKIEGNINDKDLMFLEKLKNLTCIDLKEAKGEFYDFPSLPQLKEVYFPDNTVLNAAIRKNIGKCRNIETLSFCGVRDFKNNGYFTELPKLKKVILSNITTYLYDISTPFPVKPQKIEKLIVKSGHLNIKEYSSTYMGFIPKVIIYNDNKIINDGISSLKDLKGLIFLPKSNVDLKLQGLDTIKSLVIEYNKLEINKGYFNNSSIKELLTDTSGRLLSIKDSAFYNCKQLSKVIFNRPEEIGENAFKNCEKISKLSFGNNAIIGKFAFNSRMIDTLTFNGKAEIRKGAFSNCKNISKLSFNKDAVIDELAFDSCKIDTLIFYGKVSIKSKAFNSVKCMIFNKKPDFIDCNFVNDDCAIFCDEGFEVIKYNNPQVCVYKSNGKLCNHIDVTLKKPGTILSYLSVDSLKYIYSLKIKGVLYETDFEIIKKCTNLQYLDISQTFPTYSPEKEKKINDEVETLKGLFSLLGVAADEKYNNGEMNTTDYLSAKFITSIVEGNDKVEKANDNCKIPYSVFENMKFLKTVKLPLRLKVIPNEAFYGCENLESVELPPFLEKIGKHAFGKCNKLKLDKFPKSLREIGESAFKNCKAIKNVDLSSCNMKGDFSLSPFYDCELEELRLPESITSISRMPAIYGSNNDKPNKFVVKSIYFPTGLKSINNSIIEGCNLYFQSKTPPSISEGFIENNTIYIPKNSITAYYTKFGEKNSYKEE